MPGNASTLRRAFTVFRVTLGAVVLYGSLPTAVAATATGSWHLAILATVEAVGAVLFLWPRTLRLGAILMLITFAIGLIAHALRRELPADLLLYAVGTAFVALHGSIWPRPGPEGPAAS